MSTWVCCKQNPLALKSIFFTGHTVEPSKCYHSETQASLIKHCLKENAKQEPHHHHFKWENFRILPWQIWLPENPVDRGAWPAAVHRFTESWTWLQWLSMHVTNTMRREPINGYLILQNLCFHETHNWQTTSFTYQHTLGNRKNSFNIVWILTHCKALF